MSTLARLMAHKDTYKNIAPVYDRVTAGFLQNPREKIVAMLKHMECRRILDLGCGTGVLLEYMYNAGLTCAGMDFSPAMLSFAYQRFSHANLQGHNKKIHDTSKGASCEFDMCNPVDLLAGNASNLPFKTCSFDAVVCAMLLHESDDSPEQILREALRVAPRVMVLDWRMPERNLDFLFTFWVHGIERLAGKRHYKNFLAFMRSGGLRGLFERCGCRVQIEKVLKGGALSLMVASYDG